MFQYPEGFLPDSDRKNYASPQLFQHVFQYPEGFLPDSDKTPKSKNPKSKTPKSKFQYPEGFLPDSDANVANPHHANTLAALSVSVPRRVFAR